MTLRAFSFLLIPIIFSACSPDQEIEQSNVDYFHMKNLVLEMETELSLLENEIIELEQFYQKLLANRTENLRLADRSKYQFHEGFSINRPGTDSTLSSVVILKAYEDYDEKLEEIYLTNALDSSFRILFHKYDFVAQVYSNSSNQVSRVYPAYDVQELLSKDIDLTTFNFFYKGDLKNNPLKKAVWIPEVYVDPIGRGWILSLIHPVYHGDELFAVLGIDITVDTIISRYLENQDENLLIVNRNGDIVAANTNTIEMLSFPPLRNHVYRETIQSDNFRISDFNLFNSKNQEVRKMADQLLMKGENYFDFKEDFSPNYAKKTPFKLLDWVLIEIKPTRP